VTNVQAKQFSNGSSLFVTPSPRSGTLHGLLVTELGILWAKSPSRAQEVVTGALETINKGQWAVVESTAYGLTGYYDMTMRIKAVSESRKHLGELDWRFHFLPWFKDEENRIKDKQIGRAHV
jgi:hypothetical protein